MLKIDYTTVTESELKDYLRILKDTYNCFLLDEKFKEISINDLVTKQYSGNMVLYAELLNSIKYIGVFHPTKDWETLKRVFQSIYLPYLSITSPFDCESIIKNWKTIGMVFIANSSNIHQYYTDSWIEASAVEHEMHNIRAFAFGVYQKKKNS